MCSFRNALTHSSSNDIWYSWSNYQIKSSYFRYDYTTWDTCEWNVCFDCDYSAPNNTSILLDSGSVGREGGEITDNGKDYSNISLSSQESTPSSYPTLADYVLPKTIQNRYNNKYVNTFSNGVVQSSTPKYMNFIDSGDGDGSFFITYGSDFGNVLKPLYATDGSSVIVEPIEPNNNWHKWKKRNASITNSGLYVIISPKVDDTLALTINLTNPNLDNQALCVKQFINTDPDEKSHWCMRSAVSYKAIRSKYNSNRFVAPSADRQSVVLSATPYYWLFVQISSDEYYIMTRDAYKGIAINNLANGSNLVLQVYDTSNQTNLHKMTWKKYTVNNYIRLAPINNTNYAMDIEGPSSTEGTPIQIWTYSGSNQMLWTLEE